jgi:hypothetical protein
MNHPSVMIKGDAAQANFTAAQLAALARQHDHDILNELYSVEVELTLLAHMLKEPETRRSLARLRETASRSVKMMRTFLSQLITEDRSLIPAHELVDQWKADAAAFANGTIVIWDVAFDDSSHATEGRVIPGLLNQMLRIMVASFPGQPIRVHCWIESGQGIYEVSVMGDSSTRARRSEYPVLYWPALERLASRNGGELTPLPTDVGARGRVTLKLPILSAPALARCSQPVE